MRPPGPPPGWPPNLEGDGPLDHGPPPDLSKAKLDFSMWHPLDHWPGSSYCRSLYGGPRRHLSLAWDYRWHDRLLKPWHKIMCKYGHHDMRTVWTRHPLGHVHEVGKPIKVTRWSEWKGWTRCEWCSKVEDDTGTKAIMVDPPS